jgi:hypothetical protein
MRRVGARIDAHAGEPIERLRQLGDGRHAGALEQRDHIACRAHFRGRRRRRIEHVDDHFGRQQITVVGRA